MSDFSIYVVEDEELLRDQLDSVLGQHFPVRLFASGEALLSALADRRPGLVILDIGLPGIDGYDCCREIREHFDDLPVLFLSGHDTVEARLEGYEAGGDDFLVKPFSPEELLRKLKVFERIAGERANLKEQVQASEQLSSLVLASMDESGLVLQFLSKAIACETPREVGEALLHLMRGYRVQGAVQARCESECINLCSHGDSSPLEASVLGHVSTLGRMFEFRARSVFNFDHVTLMIENMPTQDSEFCGRLRDNLAIALQGADARLATLENAQAERRRHKAGQWAIENIKAAIQDIKNANRRQRNNGAELSNRLQETLTHSFVGLGLTEDQEQFISDLVYGCVDQLTAVLDQGEDTHRLLSELQTQLEAAQ